VSAPVIALRDAGKRYTKYDDRAMLLSALRLRSRSTQSDLWALRHVDLEVQEGESVGILGRNGAGKSTMLQMLAGVTAPSEGRVRVDGRVSPLISVGVGFHPELTGRENVFVNGTILGMSRQNIERRFDEIVAFAELENFIDTPVKFYSSGMFVRLGFSVALEADPDILLVDEILAVGDFAFQLKCYERMQQVRARGTTVVVVSHNLGAMRTFCERGVVLNRGQLAHDGAMFEAIGVYHGLMALRDEENADDPTLVSREEGALEVVDARLTTESGEPAAHARAGEGLVLTTTVRAHRDVDRPFVGLLIGTADRDICVYSDSNVADGYPSLRAGGAQTYQVRFPAAFPTGSYTARMTLHRHVDEYRRVQIGMSPTISFYVTGRPLVGGLTDLRASFTAAAEV